MDPTAIPSLTSAIAARGYGTGGRALPSEESVLHAITSAFGSGAPAWTESGDGAEADALASSGLDRFIDPDAAPSSATVMRAAAGARAALAGLAASAPGAAPPFGTVTAGKRAREAPAAAAPALGLPAAGDSGAPLHVLAKRPRGRPRRTPAVDAPAAAAAAYFGAAAAGSAEGGGADGAGAPAHDRGGLSLALLPDASFDEHGGAGAPVAAPRAAEDDDSDALSLPTGRPSAQPPFRGGASVGRGQHLPKAVTDLLISWVIEHKKSPYPTNGEHTVSTARHARAFCIPSLPRCRLAEEKESLKRQTGLSEVQMRNFFTNLRKRHWT